MITNKVSPQQQRSSAPALAWAAFCVFGCNTCEQYSSPSMTNDVDETIYSEASGQSAATTELAATDYTSEGLTYGSGYTCYTMCGETGFICGDGILAGAEECDDGNQSDDDSCTSACVSARCGDGFLNKNAEECDDGNLDESDQCTSVCTLNVCGDGEVSGLEECDDGNALNSDVCLSSCTAATCGDGFVLDGIEECDDGNLRGGDQCNADCMLPGRRVFVTSTEHNGVFGGVLFADGMCQERATVAGLSGSFKAWISSGNDTPASRFDKNLTDRYELVDGTLVAVDWSDLTDGTLNAPIHLDEGGVNLAGLVWTSSNEIGELTLPNCKDWSVANAAGGVGDSSATSDNWTAAAFVGCADSAHFYCFQQ